MAEKVIAQKFSILKIKLYLKEIWLRLGCGSCGIMPRCAGLCRV
jgi:hypothetical protein